MKKKKYAVGSKVTNYLEDPNQELHENALNLQQSYLAGATDPLGNILEGAGGMLMDSGMKMLSKGMAGKAGGMDGKGTSLGGMLGKAGMNDKLAGGIQGQLTGALNSGALTGLLSGGFFATGGTVPGVPIEAEGKEIVETPDGQVTELQGPSHENGGIDLVLPEGTEIFSKRLKGSDGKTMADRKKYRESKLSKLEKLLEKSPGDKILKKTLNRAKSNFEKQEQEDLALMESARQILETTNKMLYGGKAKYLTGGEIALLKGVVGSGAADPVFDAVGLQNFLSDTDHAENATMFGNLGNTGSSFAAGDTNKPDLAGGQGTNPLNMIMDNFSLGNVLSGIGAYKSMTDPLKTLKSHLADTPPNENHYANFGQDALAALEDSRMNVNSIADNQKRDLSLTTSSAQKRARNSARGINQMRALDLAITADSNKAQRNIDSNTMSQLMNIDFRKAQLENQQDQAVMQGEAARDLADRQDMAAYYSNLMMLQSANAQNLQTLGKTFNNQKRDKASLDLFGDIYKNAEYKDGKIKHKKSV